VNCQLLLAVYAAVINQILFQDKEGGKP